MILRSTSPAIILWDASTSVCTSLSASIKPSAVGFLTQCISAPNHDSVRPPANYTKRILAESNEAAHIHWHLPLLLPRSDCESTSLTATALACTLLPHTLSHEDGLNAGQGGEGTGTQFSWWTGQFWAEFKWTWSDLWTFHRIGAGGIRMDLIVFHLLELRMWTLYWPD